MIYWSHLHTTVEVSIPSPTSPPSTKHTHYLIMREVDALDLSIFLDTSMQKEALAFQDRRRKLYW